MVVDHDFLFEISVTEGTRDHISLSLTLKWIRITS